MEAEVQLMINKLMSLNLGTFINNINELILIPKINLYFKLDDVKNELDFKCKLLEWCSRSACKGVSTYWQKKTRNMINYMLNENFGEKEFDLIYSELGNCINHQLTIRFIESGYEMSELWRNYKGK